MEQNKNTFLKILIVVQIILMMFLICKLLQRTSPISVTHEVPIPGKDGRTPVKGVDYFDGKDGENAVSNNTLRVVDQPIYTNIAPTNDQLAQAVATYCQQNNCQGPAGQPGDPGASARPEEQRCVVGLDGRSQIQHRYQGDDGWTTLYYLPEGSTCP